MKIVLAGGSGQLGTVLARDFSGRGNDVVVLSRDPDSGPSVPWRRVAWDARTPGPWTNELEGADLVVGLAGRTVNCRYTPANRDAIRRSRVDSTVVIGEACANARKPPRAWFQLSSATIYTHTYGPAQDEHGTIGEARDAPDTWHFSVDVAREWEAATYVHPLPATRLVLLRASMVMNAAPGSIFGTLLGLVRAGLGGPVAGGRQYISWIHEDDFAAAVRFLLERGDLAGPVNVASPGPLPQAPFMAALRRAWGQPIGLPATGPGWWRSVPGCSAPRAS